VQPENWRSISSLSALMGILVSSVYCLAARPNELFSTRHVSRSQSKIILAVARANQSKLRRNQRNPRYFPILHSVILGGAGSGGPVKFGAAFGQNMDSTFLDRARFFPMSKAVARWR
jgi:hypothetical protein